MLVLGLRLVTGTEGGGTGGRRGGGDIAAERRRWSGEGG